MLAKKLLGATSAKDKLWVDDCFATHLYTGNGGTQQINNGIDLAGEGGLIWIKSRTGTTPHMLVDTVRGLNSLSTNNTSPNNGFASVYPHEGGGFNLSSDTTWVNGSGIPYASWTFRRAKKFFDIVTYTGDGVAGRQIPHGLGCEVGMLASKSTSATGDWNVYHRSATGDLVLNSTAAQTGSRTLITAATESTFTVSGAANTSGVQYVAYLWAHDPSEDGIVQCGSFTDLNNGQTIDLGWEPQFILTKNANATEHWKMFDVMRGATANGDPQRLRPNTSDAESTQAYNTGGVRVTSTGFTYRDTGAINNNNVIYLAIRRPNKPPKSGAEVYNAIALNGTGAAAIVSGVGFPVDARVSSTRNSNDGSLWFDRLRGPSPYLIANILNGDIGSGINTKFDLMDGVSLGSSAGNFSGKSYIHHFFRRASGFHDQICYTGTGANKTEAHNLTKSPELWLAKRRNAAGSWVWGSTLLNANEKIVMPSPNGRVTDATAWNSTYPTDTNISLGTLADVNASGGTYTLYMWATLAGISKVGTYTGNGTSQTIDCGFSTGARFIMVIRLTAGVSQDIYLWDSARGITSGNDPRLSLNTTAAEVTTDDSVDPAPEGFICNQVAATNINVSGAEYLFLAIS